MKSLGKIALWGLSAVAFLGLLWVVFSDWATITPESGITNYFVIFSFVAVLLSVVLFLLFKVTDIMKHPKHLKELIFVFGLIIATFVIGLIFGGGGEYIDPDTGKLISAGKMRLIGASIVSFIIMLVLAFAFLIWDVLKGLIKG